MKARSMVWCALIAVCVGLISGSAALGLACLGYGSAACHALGRRASRVARVQARAESLELLACTAADLRAGAMPAPLVLPDRDLDRLARAAQRISDRTGAPLADLFDRLERQQAALSRLDSSAHAQGAGIRASVALLLGLPLIGLALGHLIGADAIGVLLHTEIGQTMAALALALQLAGLAWVDRLMNGSEPKPQRLGRDRADDFLRPSFGQRLRARLGLRRARVLGQRIGVQTFEQRPRLEGFGPRFSAQDVSDGLRPDDFGPRIDAGGVSDGLGQRLRAHGLGKVISAPHVEAQAHPVDAGTSPPPVDSRALARTATPLPRIGVVRPSFMARIRAYLRLARGPASARNAAPTRNSAVFGGRAQAGSGVPAVIPTVRRGLFPAGSAKPTRSSAALAAELAVAADLMAASLRAGAPVGVAVVAAGETLAGPLSTALTRIGQELRLGVTPAEAWQPLSAIAEARRVVNAACRSAESGAALSGALTRCADDLRAAIEHTQQARAQRVAVLLVLPLGLCFLPAFVLAGLGPVVLAVLREVW